MISTIRRSAVLALSLVTLSAGPLSGQDEHTADAAAAVERILRGGDDPRAWTSLADVLSAKADTTFLDIPTPAELVAATLADSLTVAAEAGTASPSSVVARASTWFGAVRAWTGRIPTPTWSIAAGVIVFLLAVARVLGRSGGHASRKRRPTRGARRGPRAGAEPICRDAARLEARLRSRRAA